MSCRFTPIFSLFIFTVLVCPQTKAETADIPSPDAYRKYAITRDGDPTKGKELFFNERTLCAQCHTVDGSNKLAGPDLASAGVILSIRFNSLDNGTVRQHYDRVFLVSSYNQKRANFYWNLKGIHKKNSSSPVSARLDTELKETRLKIKLPARFQ